MSSEQYEADALFGEDAFGLDKTEANDLLDLRERFDKLSPIDRMPLAEAYIRSVDELLVRVELDKAEQAAAMRASVCGMCEEEITPEDVVVERQMVWVTPGSNQVQIREEMGERAHAACAKRVKDGGNAEAPLF